MTNPLKILNLKSGDSIEVAHRNRNLLFLRLHPDKNPKDKEQYQVVYNAYEEIKAHPELLTNSATPMHNNANANAIRLGLTVRLEDVYFNKKFSTTVKCARICGKCLGSGSIDIKGGQCAYCGGTGDIKSSILSMLGKVSTCPICSGTGVNPNSLCSTCSGRKYTIKDFTITFSIDLQSYINKYLVIPNVGNQTAKGVYGDIIVVLNTTPCPSVKIEENHFVIFDEVSCVQRIVGDTKRVKIFGKELAYTIGMNSTEAYILDKDVDKKIKIKYIESTPQLTEETKILYKKILEIEKNIKSRKNS